MKKFYILCLCAFAIADVGSVTGCNIELPSERKECLSFDESVSTIIQEANCIPYELKNYSEDFVSGVILNMKSLQSESFINFPEGKVINKPVKGKEKLYLWNCSFAFK